MKATSKVVKKTKYNCQDGPFEGSDLLLATPNTLPFSVGKFNGRYVGCRKEARITNKKGLNGNFIWDQADVKTTNPVDASYLIWEPLTKKKGKIMNNDKLPPGTYKVEGTILVTDHGKVLTTTIKAKVAKGPHKGARLELHENVNKAVQEVNGQEIEVR